jgi:hypothetical protein
MTIPWKPILWQQFGAAIDMLDDALRTRLTGSTPG